MSAPPWRTSTAVKGQELAFLQPDGSVVIPRFGVNSIALDGANEWLYFGPFSGTGLYRVRTADLADAGLSPDALAARVERYADKPISDGIAIDNDGNIYISDVSASAIGVIPSTDRNYRHEQQDDDLIAWPDSFSFGPDGYVYVTLTQVHRAPFMNGGGEGSLRPPFNIVRFKGLAPGVTGR